MKKFTLASLAALTVALGAISPAMARDYDRDGDRYHASRDCRHGRCDHDRRYDYREHRRWRFFDWHRSKHHHDRDYYRDRDRRRD